MAGTKHREHDLVAALLRRDDRVLLCHRTLDRKFFPDVWVIPSGHVEGAERAEDALAREIKEQLGLRIAPAAGPPLAKIETPTLRLRIWLIRKWRGELFNHASDEHDAIAWFTLGEVRQLRLADPRYIEIVERGVRNRPQAPRPRLHRKKS